MPWLFGPTDPSILTDHLLAALIRGVLVLATAAVLCFALRRGSASVRHFIWTSALAGVLALPLLSFVFPAWQVAVLPSQAYAPATTEIGSQVPGTAIPLPASEPVTSASEPAEISANTTPGQLTPMPPASARWAVWVFMLWLLVSLLIAGRRLIGSASIWWIARRATKITNLEWINAANDISWQIGLMRRVTMLKSDSITMPVACGLIKPLILFPLEAEEWPDERRRVVLAHELAHVKRWDCLTQLLAQITCSIYWLNPLVWVATRQLRIERERACDDQVLEVGTRASDYAGHLLDMARTFRSGRCTSFAAVAVARRSELEGRLLAILDPKAKRRGLNSAAATALGAVMVCLVLPLSTIRLSAKAQPDNSDVISTTTSSNTPGILHQLTGDSPREKESNRSEPQSQPVSAENARELVEPKEGMDPQSNHEASAEPAPQEDKTPVIQALREAMKDEDPEVRQHALFALSQIGDQQAIAALIEALKDSNWQKRAQAAHTLGLRGGTTSIEALIGALKDSAWQVREQAAWGLGLRGDARAIDSLIGALIDEHPDVREKAAWALGLKGDNRSVEPLTSALADPVAKVRAMAAWALGLKFDQRAATALKNALEDPDKGVRQKAAWALGMLLIQRGEE